MSLDQGRVGWQCSQYYEHSRARRALCYLSKPRLYIFVLNGTKRTTWERPLRSIENKYPDRKPVLQHKEVLQRSSRRHAATYVAIAHISPVSNPSSDVVGAKKCDNSQGEWVCGGAFPCNRPRATLDALANSAGIG